MSTVKANNYYDASGGSNAQLYGVASPPNSMGFRNRILNGDCRIDQRNAGASVTPTNGQYTLDRWRFFVSQASKLTSQQSQGAVTPPPGFAKYLGVTSSSAYSVGSSDNFNLMTSFESCNVYDFAWGTSSAATVTLSFWVRSSLTGTFGGAVRNWAYTRSYPFTYSINAANTWEYKTISIPGDTSGTWDMTGGNSGAIEVLWGLGVGATLSGTAGSWQTANFLSATGATSVVGTNGATWYITGVQLEAGTVASAFERRDYGRELMMCQRYCQVYINSDSANQRHSTFAVGTSSTNVDSIFLFKATMRASPSLSVDTIGNLRLSDGVSSSTPSASSILGSVTNSNQALVAFTGTGLTQFRPYFIEGNGTLNSAKITFSAEL